MNGRLMFAILLVALCLSTKAQPISKGGFAADLEFGNVLNYKYDTLGFSDLHGKLIILDFWGFTCISCLRAFPKVDSLQSLFSDKIQIILVNMESKDSTEDFFRRRPKLKRPNVPMITQAARLGRLFPHRGVPFHVWIDTSGKVIFRTDGMNTNKEKIEAYFSGRNVDLPDAPNGYYPVHSFLSAEWEQAIDYCSYISRCISAIAFGPNHHKDGTLQIQMKCASIVELYLTAIRGFEGFDFIPPWEVVLEVSHPENFRRPSTRDADAYNRWQSDHCFNYHLYWPEDRKNETFKCMRSDLDRYFNLESRIEKRPVPSLVLVRTSGKDKLRTRGGKPVNTLIPADEKSTKIDSLRFFLNQPFSGLSLRLKLFVERQLHIPFVDLTGLDENIDFEMSGEVLDEITLDGLSKELRRYDLALEKKEVMMDVLVLKERGERK